MSHPVDKGHQGVDVTQAFAQSKTRILSPPDFECQFHYPLQQLNFSEPSHCLEFGFWLECVWEGQEWAETLTKQWPGKWWRQGAFVWGDKAGEYTEGTRRNERLVQYFWINVHGWQHLGMCKWRVFICQKLRIHSWLLNPSDCADFLIYLCNCFGKSRLHSECEVTDISFNTRISTTHSHFWRQSIQDRSHRFNL